MKNSFLFGRYFIPLFLSLAVLAMSCGEQPKFVRGSAGYQYAEAKKAVSEIKFEKAISLTGEILNKSANSEYADKARILRIILLSGLSQGYGRMAEAHLDGFEKSIKNAGALRSIAFDYYRKQKNDVLGFYQSCDFFLKNYSQQTPYVLEMDFPSKDLMQNRRLDEVRSGKLLAPEQLKAAEEDELCNGLISSLSGFLGAGGDRAKARKLLEGGSRTLDHAEFMVMLGRSLLDGQKVFGRAALNDIQNYRQFYQKSFECSQLALKILKDNPNQEVQNQADQLKTDIELLEKNRTKTSSS
jgi:hypothetical protein